MVYIVYYTIYIYNNTYTISPIQYYVDLFIKYYNQLLILKKIFLYFHLIFRMSFFYDNRFRYNRTVQLEPDVRIYDSSLDTVMFNKYSIVRISFF